MTNPWIPEEDLPLVSEFFIKFARLEYALKKHQNFSTKPGNNFKASIEKLKKHLKDSSINTPDSLRSIIEEFKVDPPNKQTGPGPSDFKDTTQDKSDWGVLIECLSRMRNNLFHGGKMPWDTYRDRRVLGYGLTIINALVGESREQPGVAPPEIKNAYWGN